jgi:hypothetical protein
MVQGKDDEAVTYQNSKTGLASLRIVKGVHRLIHISDNNMEEGHQSPTIKSKFISKMYFSHWKPPGVSERMWSVNLDESISGEYETLGGHSCRPSE